MINNEPLDDSRLLFTFFSVTFLCITVFSLFPLSALANQPPLLLDEVVTTASRIDTPLRQVGTAMTVITREEIAQQGYTQISDILRTQPGVFISNNGGRGQVSTLNIRGEEGYRTRILIDGMNIASPTSPQVAPRIEHLIGVAHIERIEILRGPQGLMWGADAGGVINIITRTAHKEGLSSQIVAETASRYNTHLVSGVVSASEQDQSLMIGAVQHKTSGFNARAIDPSNEADGYENTTVHLKLNKQFSDHIDAQTTLRKVNADNEYDRISFGQFDTPGVIPNQVHSRYDQTQARVQIKHQRNEQGYQQWALDYSAIDTENRSNIGPEFGSKGHIKSLQYLMSRPLSARTHSVFGLDHTLTAVTPMASTEEDTQQTGVYAELQHLLTQDWSVTAGIRHDQDADFGEHNSMRLTSAYTRPLGAWGWMKYRASAGNGFRAPSLFELTFNRSTTAQAANAPDLEEETSRGFDAGIDYWMPNGTQLSLTYFDQIIRNEIVYDFDQNHYAQLSGDTQSKGAEIDFHWPLLQSLELMGNYTYNEARTRNGQRRIRRPRHLANLGIQLTPNDRSTLAVHLNSAYDRLGLSGQVLEHLNTLDLTTQYRLNPHLTLTGRIENVTDEDDALVAGYYRAGAAVYVGARLTF